MSKETHIEHLIKLIRKEKVSLIRFDGNDITDATHMVNGLVMTRGFRQILVAPAIKEINLTFRKKS